MTKQITGARAIDDFKIEVEFDGVEKRLFDITPFLDKGIFRELRDPAYFRTVRLIHGGIAWPNDQDLSADTLYLRSAPAQASAGIQNDGLIPSSASPTS